MDKVGIGIVGCGAISGAYLTHAKNWTDILEIRALADLNVDVARKRQEEFGVGRACTVDELMTDPSVDIVINLTIPAAHGPVAMQALANGKHVYSEKPMCATRPEGQKLYDEAKAKGLRVGGAPDTFFGAGHQTARKLIDDGAIGRPIAAEAFMLGRGHEGWHPSPEFYYKPGGGPMFDMGPYYVTDLLQLLGPIKRVMGVASIAIPERTITSEPLKGQKIKVETPDHVSGIAEFASGVVLSITTSFAVAGANYDGGHPIHIHGEEGSIRVPDPNGFDGTVLLKKRGEPDWTEVPFEHCTGYGRIVGVADMAKAIADNRPHRASAELVYNVLDTMQGFLDSSDSGKAHLLTTPFERPAAMPTGLKLGELD